MVYSKLPALTSGPLADVASSALSLVDAPVFLCGDAVGLTDMRGVIVAALLLLIQLMVAVAPRSRIPCYTISRDTFRDTVTAPLLFSRSLLSQLLSLPLQPRSIND